MKSRLHSKRWEEENANEEIKRKQYSTFYFNVRIVSFYKIEKDKEEACSSENKPQSVRQQLQNVHNNYQASEWIKKRE